MTQFADYQDNVAGSLLRPRIFANVYLIILIYAQNKKFIL